MRKGARKEKKRKEDEKRKAAEEAAKPREIKKLSTMFNKLGTTSLVSSSDLEKRLYSSRVPQPIVLL